MTLNNAIAVLSGLLCTMSYSQQTIEELAEKIEFAAKSKSPNEFKSLRYTTGEPKELNEFTSEMFALFGNKNLKVSNSKPKIHTFKDYTPELDLPGSHKGKILEYLIKPTHWIVITLYPSRLAVVNLNVPAVKINSTWQIPGIKYKSSEQAVPLNGP